MPVSALLGFWLVAALLIAVPGPDWAFVVAAGLRGRALPAAGGIVLGYLGVTAATAAGLGALAATAPVALTCLSVVGGGYLAWLGAGAILRPAGTPAAGSAPGSRMAVLARGAGVSALNPKGLLIFVTVLPRFTGPAAPWPLPVQIAALGGVFVLTCAVVYPVVGLGAHRLLVGRPRTTRLVSRVCGAAMVGLGLALVVEQLLG